MDASKHILYRTGPLGAQEWYSPKWNVDSLPQCAQGPSFVKDAS
jgi:hypothetical protein